MECSRSERPMLTSEIGTDWAGRVKHDLYVGNMGFKCIQSQTFFQKSVRNLKFIQSLINWPKFVKKRLLYV